MGGCDLLDNDLKVHKGVAANDCCKLCDAQDGCAGAVWESDEKKSQTGTCRLKKSAKKQIVFTSKTQGDVDASKVCWLPGANPMPAPILGTSAGIIVGDMKLIVGTMVKMTTWTGPVFPNASTPWTIDSSIDVPGVQCSTPYKIGCLFNVTADPTEHNDLGLSQWDEAKRLLDRLREWSKTYFNPDRGDADPKACKQLKKNGGFYGPWLELP